MGMEFTNLTVEDLCDLMCGRPEDDVYDNDTMIDPRDGGNHYGKDRQTEKTN